METILSMIFTFIFSIFIFRLLGIFIAIKNIKKARNAQIMEASQLQTDPPEELINKREMVWAEISGVCIPKDQAYQLSWNNQLYYFTTWNDRQNFLKKLKCAK